MASVDNGLESRRILREEWEPRQGTPVTEMLTGDLRAELKDQLTPSLRARECQVNEYANQSKKTVSDSINAVQNPRVRENIATSASSRPDHPSVRSEITKVAQSQTGS